MSVPQSNSAKTTERPTPETERTRSTPGIPCIEVSIGNVTSCSTSCGARPSASVIRVTVGRLRSGNTSTGTRGRIHEPKATSTSAAAMTKSRFLRLLLTRKLNIAASPDLVDEFGPADDDPLALGDAGPADETGGIEGLGPH